MAVRAAEGEKAREDKPLCEVESREHEANEEWPVQVHGPGGEGRDLKRPAV